MRKVLFFVIILINSIKVRTQYLIRKALLFALMLLLSTAMFAQTRGIILNENFDDSTMPAGWSVTGQGTGSWSISPTNIAGGSTNELMLNWEPIFNGLSRIVTEPVDLTGVESAVFSIKHHLNNYTGSNLIGIATSVDGVTWNTAWEQAYSSSGQHEVTETISTPDMGKENVFFCIYYDGYSCNIYNWYFDDFKVFTQENLDLKLSSVDVPSITIAGDLEVKFTVQNIGLTTIESFTIETDVINGSVQENVTETFVTNLAPFESAQFTMGTTYNLSPTTYNLSIKVVDVNGTTDGVSNNTLTKVVSAVMGQTQKIPMIEHFSSSTCGPCINVNYAMNQLTAANPGKYTYTKYPCYWPSPGDPYYTVDAQSRIDFYTIDAVPETFLDGSYQRLTSISQAALDAQYSTPAFANIRGAYTIEDSIINITADFMSYMNLTDVRAFVSINEKTTTGNTGNTYETEIHHTMMKMLGNAEGNEMTINAGEYVRLEYSFDMSSTFVEEMNDLEVALWLQNPVTHEIYNSHYAYENSEHPYPVQDLIVNNNLISWNAHPNSNPIGYDVYLDGVLVANTTETLYTSTVSDFNIVKVVALYEDDKTSVAAVNYTMKPTTISNRKVIIEEFTGRNCAYCPDGHKVANEIAAANPGKVFPVNIHAGGFAPTTYPNLNTTYGTEICNGFNVSGFPTGNINRNSPTTLGRNFWESNTDEQLSQIAEVNIEGVVDINKDTRTAEITVNLDYTANSVSSTNYLTIMMLQDSIWGSQSGASYNPEQYVDGQYCHMHVLRDIITSTWGDEINQTTAGTRIVKKYTYEIPETIGSPNGVEVDLDNIYFLAFVAEQYQDTPTRPILNVDRLRDADDVIDEPEDLENHWTADPTIYPNNMTIIGVLQLYGVEERSTDFEIGAFCGDELRGSHRLKYEHALDRYYAYLLLHGNPDDNITFKLYDHRTGQVSELINTDNITFEVNGTLGGIKNPYIFNFNDVQERQLSSGWNWFSSYINIDGSDGLSMLKNELNTNGLQIKSQNAFVSYENGSWYGTLNSTITEDMYMIQTTSPQNIELTGKKVNAEERPITLGTNWKWISYPLDVPMNVGTALININPNEGDYIKSQTGFAQYGEGLGWKGTLASMIPGDGYMYQNTSGETMTLIYPDPDTKASTDAVHNITSENNHWIPDMTKFPTNMSIIATVDNSYDNDFEVAAFCDGECRGSARPIYIEKLDSHFIFLTVYGEDKETIIFKYYDVENQEVYSINNEITYSVNATLGSLREPYIMSLTMTDTDEILANEITTYPNPVDRNVGIYLGTECDKVEIYNSMGVKVSEYENVNRIEGIETAGIYVIKIINENAIKYDRIVVR